MIRETTGNILTANVEALVNPVNTVGVMGAGLAFQFKRAFPDMFQQYVESCHQGDIRIGCVSVHEVGKTPRYVINFPTKHHWRAPSQIEWIKYGLIDLRLTIIARNIRSIAIPPLGCGLGGLEWTAVHALILEQLAGLPQVDVVLYVPEF